MGAGLLAKAVGQFAMMLDVPASSRAGSLPQGILGVHESCVHRRSIVGAGLLAKALGQFSVMLDVPASSRAGSPTGGSWVFMSLVFTAGTVWERACSRRRWVSLR